jgi:hypothetical protein
VNMRPWSGQTTLPDDPCVVPLMVPPPTPRGTP